MIPKIRSSRPFFAACCFVLFFVAASASFSGYYQKWHFAEADVSGDDSRSSIQATLDGTAYRPYVYRQLLPVIANGLDHIVSQTKKAWLLNHQGSGEDAFIYAIHDSATANDPEYFFRYLVVYTSTFLFALLAVYAMYFVCRALEFPPLIAVFAPVITILLIPYIESNGGFYYDYPELAFFALAVWVAMRFNWLWLLPITAFGAWNKESFLLIALTLYPFLRLRNSRIRAALRTGVLCVVCLAVYIPVRLRFAHNPGGTVEMWWLDQLRYFAHLRSLFFATEETYGIRIFRAYTIFPMALLVWMMVRGWKTLPSAGRRHAKIAAAINIPLYFLFSYPGELRDCSMLYIALLLLIASNMKQLQPALVS